MNIKSLKDKILQLAIQGKLVPQNEAEEPASVLLERIKAEKEQLIKDKMIKKEKPLPEIDEVEMLFELSKGWEWIRLRDITVLIGDGLHGTPVYCEQGEYYFINGNNLLNGKIYLNQATKKISKEENEKYKKKLNDTTILYSINGTVGNLAYYNNEKVMLGKSSAYINVSKFILKEYIGMLLVSPYALKIFNSNLSGTTIKNLSLQSIRNLVVPLPPLAVQKRIVSKVEELFKLIDELYNNKQGLLENISNSKNKVLQLAIQGKLVEQSEEDEPASVLLERIKVKKEQLIKDKVIKKEKLLSKTTEEEKVSELPKGWEWCRLGELVIKLGAGSTPTGGNKVYTSEGIKFIRSQNVRNEGLILDDVAYIPSNINEKMKGSIVEKGDILLNITGASIGRSCIVDESFDIGNVNQHVCIIRLIDKSMNKYIHALIISEFFQKLIRDVQVGVSREGLSMTKLRSFLIPIPPLQEQLKISNNIELMLEYLDKLQQEIESQEIILSDILQ